MMSCPTEEVLVRLVDGALSVEETERLTRHVGRCERCRHQDARLRTLIADLKAPLSVPIDVQAHVRAVMDRLDRPSTPAARPLWRRAFPLASSAVACAAAAYFVLHTPGRTTWQARGGPAQSTLARDVSVRPCAVQGGLRPLETGAVLDVATPVTATFRNLGDAPAYLLLFAVDSRHNVHWIVPRYSRPDDNPIAVTLPVSAGEGVLNTTVVLDDLSPGPLRVVAVIASAPGHVSDVEALEGTPIDAAQLARRFPTGTDIRETFVEVRDTDGDAR
jgi:hypothetical protein